MLRLNSTLMCAKQPPFEQRCDAMNTRHGHMRWVGTTADDSDLVFVVRSSQSGIASPSVGVDNRSRRYNSLHKWKQAFRGHVFDTLKADATNTTTIFLSRNGNNLLGLDFSSSLPFLGAADIGFVNLDYAKKAISSWPHHRPAQFVEPSPSRLIAAQPEYPLQAQGADTVLLAGDEPHCQKPHPQWLAGVLKNRARCQGSFTLTNPTLENPARSRPRFSCCPTTTANEPVWPTEATNIFSPCRIVAEPVVHFLECPWIINRWNRVL